MNKKIKRIGLLTSGGDAPGMNAAVRAVVRMAEKNNVEVFGFLRGYEGLLDSNYTILTSSSVSNIIREGGTKLKTSRSKDFKDDPENQKHAAYVCMRNKLQALIVIGGDGSFKGMRVLSNLGVPTIGIPGTIDGDVKCSDNTIGLYTAIEEAVTLVDNLRATANAMGRCFVVEIMGNMCGKLALLVAIATGADFCVVPEVPYDIEKIAKHLQKRKELGKESHIIIVAEGCLGTQDGPKDIKDFARIIEEASGIETKDQNLGYFVRSDRTSGLDRIISTELGIYAMKLFLKGKTNRIVAFNNGAIVDYDIEEATTMERHFAMDLYNEFKTVALIDDWIWYKKPAHYYEQVFRFL